MCVCVCVHVVYTYMWLLATSDTPIDKEAATATLYSYMYRVPPIPPTDFGHPTKTAGIPWSSNLSKAWLWACL